MLADLPLVRPMRVADVPAAAAVSSAAFLEVDRRERRAGDPEPEARSASAGATAAWEERTRHLLAHDPGGCWVAEDDEGMVGFATSFRRDTLWGLCTYAVRPGAQGRGAGRAVLDAALTYSQGCVRGMICSSHDPGALRRYHRAGFRLWPTAGAAGVVDRALLPAVEGVRDGTAGDRDLLDSVDRQVRGATHGVDHAFLLGRHRLLVADGHLGSGYAYLGAGGAGLYLLAATGRRLAQDLLWTVLAESTPGAVVGVRPLTGEQDWALDVTMAARLPVVRSAYLALRFLPPPAPYVPSPHFL